MPALVIAQKHPAMPGLNTASATVIRFAGPPAPRGQRIENPKICRFRRRNPQQIVGRIASSSDWSVYNFENLQMIWPAAVQ